MREKAFKRITALLICLVMLCTCACGNGAVQFGKFGSHSGARDGIKFSDMEYIRPDMDTLLNFVDSIKAALDAKDTAAVKEIVLDCEEAFDNYNTMSAIAMIRNSQNLFDTFYADEYEWLDSSCTEIQNIGNSIAAAVKESDISKKIMRQDYWQEFEYNYTNDYEYTQELLALYDREAELEAQYRLLQASPNITVDGVEYDYSDYMNSVEDDEGWIKGLASFYETYNEPTAEIYIELISVREKIAELLGYDSYKEYQYDIYYRDYTVEDEEKFIALTKEYLVPLYTEIRKSVNDGMLYAQADMELCEECVETMAAELGGGIAEAFSYMKKYELYDVEAAAAKLPGAYTTIIPGYEEPYLFISPEETARDIFNFAHEFGHYCDYYHNDTYFEALDVAECYSIALEYLMTDYLNLILEDESCRLLTEAEMFSALEMSIMQTAFAEFENRVYALDADELTVEKINEISNGVDKEFGLSTELKDIFHGMDWIEIAHFISSPFYVISYSVSNNLALQIIAAEYEHEGDGIALYTKMLKRRSDTLLDFVKECKLDSPFEEESMKNCAEFLKMILT